MDKLPEKIQTDEDAGAWLKALGRMKKEELTGLLTRIMARHPESIEWVEEERNSPVRPYEDLAKDARRKERAEEGLRKLRDQWKKVREWTIQAESTHGQLDYFDDLVAYDDGWKLVDRINSVDTIYVPWEERLTLMKEIAGLRDDARYFDWGDIAYEAMAGLVFNSEENDRLGELIRKEEVCSPFIYEVHKQ
ncbi:MAG: hypothetical protein IJ088_05880 [Clostridia bacterium]|nr:hypothetical protein [Clostridia bacterium]